MGRDAGGRGARLSRWPRGRVAVHLQGGEQMAGGRTSTSTEGFLARSKLVQMERTLSFATRFLNEMREEIDRAAAAGSDIPPRIRSVHERAGHATPEFRTLAIPVPETLGGFSPEILSGAIARYAAQKSPDCLMLALQAEMAGEDGASGPVLIAEARDRLGTRLFWMQRYTLNGPRVAWDDPTEGGWRDPGEEEMILDAAFTKGRGR
jgi:hypothetical protein